MSCRPTRQVTISWSPVVGSCSSSGAGGVEATLLEEEEGEQVADPHALVRPRGSAGRWLRRGAERPGPCPRWRWRAGRRAATRRPASGRSQPSSAASRIRETSSAFSGASAGRYFTMLFSAAGDEQPVADGLGLVDALPQGLPRLPRSGSAGRPWPSRAPPWPGPARAWRRPRRPRRWPGRPSAIGLLGPLAAACRIWASEARFLARSSPAGSSSVSASIPAASTQSAVVVVRSRGRAGPSRRDAADCRDRVALPSASAGPSARRGASPRRTGRASQAARPRPPAARRRRAPPAAPPAPARSAWCVEPPAR